MKPEPFPGAYFNLCLSIWVIALFWLPQQTIRKKWPKGETVDKIIWSLILPHFTEKGIESFKEFFGADYYNNLGKPFEVDLNMAFF